MATVGKKRLVLEPVGFITKDIKSPGASLSDVMRHARHDDARGSWHGSVLKVAADYPCGAKERAQPSCSRYLRFARPEFHQRHRNSFPKFLLCYPRWPMPQMAGKCALVTGSTQGLGQATAVALAAAGCHVVLNGIANDAAVAALRGDIERAHGVKTMYSPADLRDPSQIERMVGDAIAAFGSVDILVNNAVVRHNAPIEEFTAADWDEALAVNLSAAFHTIRVALPAMKRNGWGRIVNVSSIYGLRGATNRVGYVTTKTALIGLTRAVALETAGAGVTCNAVCPGTSDTPTHDATIRSRMAARGMSRSDAERELLIGKQPTGRLIAAESVASLIAFLCSPDAADITGAVAPVDGGWSVA
jgi:3-hydroxybutyrate dehydrogenase